ncbi:hypothetical protein QM012_003382 [Aureobasidium pullulans]|uniref:Ankyrin n=1 Tax=Aureobasidium pullulans TaxID=5580 RepID=A0ABR0T8M2_AURPU
MLLQPWTAELVGQQLDNFRDPWITLLFAHLQQLQPNLAGNYFVIIKTLKDIDQKGPVQRNLAISCFRWILSAIRPLHWSELQTALALGNTAGGEIQADHAHQIDYSSFNYYAINHFDKHLVISESLSEPPSKPLICIQQMLERGRIYLLRFLLMRLYLSPYIGGGLRQISPADVDFETLPQLIIWTTDLYKIRTKFRPHMAMSPGRLLRAFARAGLLVAVKNLIREKYFAKAEHDINEAEDGESALYIACDNGQAEIVEELLAAGACPQPDTITPLCWIDCETPLFRAILEGHISVVDLLLKAGVDVNVPTDLYGWYTYPLQLAQIHEHYDIAELLVEHGADRNLFEGIRVTVTVTETHIIADPERF